MLLLATPRKSTFRLTGSQGGALPVEVTSGVGARPAIILWPSGELPGGLTDRLARAGFAVVAAPSGGSAADLGLLVAALAAGELGPPPTALGIAFVGGEPAPDIAQVAQGAGFPALVASTPDDGVGMVRWFAERLS